MYRGRKLQALGNICSLIIDGRGGRKVRSAGIKRDTFFSSNELPFLRSQSEVDEALEVRTPRAPSVSGFLFNYIYKHN